MHQQRTAEKNDRHDEERKKHHYERVIDICKTFVDTIMFEREFAKSHLRSILNENRVHHMKTKTRNAKTCMQHDFD
jgi:hypothetical protein